MVIPDHIDDAAREANLGVVEAWLNEAGPGAVNETDEYGSTLLRLCLTRSIEERHVQLARMLIARGADVNIVSQYNSAPLHMASFPGDFASSAVSLLLQAGARVNVKNQDEDLTPLAQLIQKFDYCVGENAMPARQRRVSRSGLEIMKLLLRAGASIDRCERDLSAEACMQEFLTRRPNYVNDDSFTRCQEIVAGVRAHGSYKAFAREPHRKFLRLRSLLVRGRAKVRGRRLERIARLPNGACWHVLSYLWEAA